MPRLKILLPREQVKWMVNDGVSLRRTRNYLHRLVLWWVQTSKTWHYEELAHWFIRSCWDQRLATLVAGLLRKTTSPNTGSLCDAGVVA